MRLIIDYVDGQWTVRPADTDTPEDSCVSVRDEVYTAYLDWCRQGTVFDALFTALDNERWRDRESNGRRVGDNCSRGCGGRLELNCNNCKDG